jgi:hypothetical protein
VTNFYWISQISVTKISCYLQHLIYGPWKIRTFQLFFLEPNWFNHGNLWTYFLASKYEHHHINPHRIKPRKLNKEKEWTPKQPIINTFSKSHNCFGPQLIPFKTPTLVNTPCHQNRSHNIPTMWHFSSFQSRAMNCCSRNLWNFHLLQLVLTLNIIVCLFLEEI